MAELVEMVKAGLEEVNASLGLGHRCKFGGGHAEEGAGFDAEIKQCQPRKLKTSEVNGSQRIERNMGASMPMGPAACRMSVLNWPSFAGPLPPFMGCL